MGYQECGVGARDSPLTSFKEFDIKVALFDTIHHL